MHPIFAMRRLWGEKISSILPGFPGYKKAMNNQLDFIHNVKRHIIQNISGVRTEKQGMLKDFTYLLKFIQNLLKMVTRKPHCLE